MTREEHIEYWRSSAEEDLPLINDLFNKGYFLWSLFVTHLVVEKLLKAHYVKSNEENVPKIHNLLIIAQKTNLILSEQNIEIFDKLNPFQIAARYLDYKKKLTKLCTKEYTNKLLKDSEELIQWLISQLK